MYWKRHARKQSYLDWRNWIRPWKTSCKMLFPGARESMHPNFSSFHFTVWWVTLHQGLLCALSCSKHSPMQHCIICDMPQNTGCGIKKSPIWEANKFKTKEDTANVFFYFRKVHRMPFYINVFWTKHHSSGGLEYWYTDVASLGSCPWPWEWQQFPVRDSEVWGRCS